MVSLANKIHPINTAVEQHFYRRNALIFELERKRQELVDTEYKIALQCCPFYLGQRLWYEDHFERIRVYVCEIQFKNKSPFYEFWVRSEKNRGIALPKRIKVKLKYIAGIENTFVEPMEQYQTRLKELVEKRYIKLKPQYCSFDTPYIISVTAIAQRSNAIVEIGKARSEWYQQIFDMKILKDQ